MSTLAEVNDMRDRGLFIVEEGSGVVFVLQGINLPLFPLHSSRILSGGERWGPFVGLHVTNFRLTVRIT